MRRLGTTRIFPPSTVRKLHNVPLTRIQNATFYRQDPRANDSADNPPLFPQLDFTLDSDSGNQWAILSPSSSSRTAFLDILRGRYICDPPTGRSYPYLASEELAKTRPKNRDLTRAIQYVGYDADRGGLGGTKGAYLSARYESMREATDWTLQDYLQGKTQLNAAEDLDHPSLDQVQSILDELHLSHCAHLPVSNLSNGQTRRARLAKALLAQPELLLMDMPFQGLDPITLNQVSKVLCRLSSSNQVKLFLALHPHDYIPDWITHFVVATNEPQVRLMGTKDHVYRSLARHFKQTQKLIYSCIQAYDKIHNTGISSKAPKRVGEVIDISDKSVDESVALREIARLLESKGDMDFIHDDPQEIAAIRQRRRTYPERAIEGMFITRDGIFCKIEKRLDSARTRNGLEFMRRIPAGEPVVEMEGVQVRYKPDEPAVLGDWHEKIDVEYEQGESVMLRREPVEPTVTRRGLWWTVRQGERWGLFGPNGSGKTTLLSLITSDHPQTYSAPVKLFGRSRLPTPGQPGISIFDIQRRIGISSPEVHAFFPKHLCVRRVLESAWADTPLTRPKLTGEDDERVEVCLRWFRNELNPALGDETLDRYSRYRCDRTHRDREFKKARKFPVYKDRMWGKDCDNELPPKYFMVVAACMDKDKMNGIDLDWADSIRFGDLPFSGQRVALFLRAIVKRPDLVVLDEAFSGMDEFAREKCMLFLHHGERMNLRLTNSTDRLVPGGPRARESDRSVLQRVTVSGLSDRQALIVVAHKREDVPSSVRKYLTLPEPGSGRPPLVGDLPFPVKTEYRLWPAIWGITQFSQLAREEGDPFSWKGSPFETYGAGCQEEVFKLAPRPYQLPEHRKPKPKPEKPTKPADARRPGRPRVKPVPSVDEESSKSTGLDEFDRGADDPEKPKKFKKRSPGRPRKPPVPDESSELVDLDEFYDLLKVDGDGDEPASTRDINEEDEEEMGRKMGE